MCHGAHCSNDKTCLAYKRAIKFLLNKPARHKIKVPSSTRQTPKPVINNNNFQKNTSNINKFKTNSQHNQTNQDVNKLLDQPINLGDLINILVKLNINNKLTSTFIVNPSPNQIHQAINYVSETLNLKGPDNIVDNITLRLYGTINSAPSTVSQYNKINMANTILIQGLNYNYITT